MRRLTAVLFASIMLIVSLAYAGNGDLIVDGNLGVGTSNPGSKLEVLGTTNSRITESVPNGINGLYSDILFRGTFSNYPTDTFRRDVGLIRSGFSTGVWSTGYMSFGVAGFDCMNENVPEPCTRMIITNNGNVGIGTVNPTYPLQVQKTSSGPAIMIGGGAPGQPRLQIYGLDADANAWMGLGTDMAGGPYEHSIYYSVGTSNNGRLTFGTFDGSSYSEKMRITATGNVGIGTVSPTYKLDVQGQVASNGTVLTSDAKFKKNLLPILAPLDKVLNMTGLTYEWKTDEYKDKGFSKGRHYGVIAQDIEKVLPEVVVTNSKGEKSVAYTEIIPVMIEAIKEQQKMIEQQQKQLNELQQLLLKK